MILPTRRAASPARFAAEANPRSATQTSRCNFQPSRSSLTRRMIAVSDSLPGKVQQRTGTPSRVTAIAITTCGRSLQWSVECPNRRVADSAGLAVSPSSASSRRASARSSGTSTSQEVEVVSTQNDVKIKVQQVRDRGEHLRGDLLQRLEQEVHRPVGSVVAEASEVLDDHPLGQLTVDLPTGPRPGGPIPSRSHTRSSTHAPPSRRASNTSTSVAAAAATEVEVL